MGAVDRDDPLQCVEWRGAGATKQLAAMRPPRQSIEVHVDGGYVELPSGPDAHRHSGRLPTDVRVARTRGSRASGAARARHAAHHAAADGAELFDRLASAEV